MCLEQGALYIVDAGTDQNSSTEAEQSAGEGTASLSESLVSKKPGSLKISVSKCFSPGELPVATL